MRTENELYFISRRHMLFQVTSLTHPTISIVHLFFAALDMHMCFGTLVYNIVCGMQCEQAMHSSIIKPTWATTKNQRTNEPKKTLL